MEALARERLIPAAPARPASKPGYVPALPTLWPSSLWAQPRAELAFPFDSPQVRYFYFARNAVWLATKVLGLEGHEDALIEELSGGPQQRVAVARAVALNPDVLLADEPTAEQDPVFRALVLSRLLDVADRGGVLVLATHDPEVAHRCTRTLHTRPEAELPDLD